LSAIEIKAIVASDREAGLYAVYGDNRLWLVKAGSTALSEAAKLSNIQALTHDIVDGRGQEHEIALCFHHPYVCVTERFGVNGALVNLTTGQTRDLRREDYHCDVSSYSIGFLEWQGRTLLVCQTQWNRLDLFDADSGELLTDREVYCRDTGRKRANGSPEYEEKNYMDYFHSQLHIAPDGRHFLSNGWVWSPFDQVRVFDTEEFFRTFELGGAAVDYSSGYNWDRPCAFIDSDLFVIATDDPEGESDSAPRGLTFFRVSAEAWENKHGFRGIDSCSSVACDVFPKKYGEVKGKLYYDQSGGYLVALTSCGAFAVALTGEPLACLPDVATTVFPSHEDLGSRYNLNLGWDYSPAHRVFYTWRKGVGVVEQRAFSPRASTDPNP
jgi:hypothetical protein